ncbi:MAG: GDP-mannose 4,6-dehydratase [Candidatus Taylorbacteria bacterium RIFCSPHIGHO2_01_FULL_51_15]|uniref:GDP-mannose 4,6-dehydratase n=1 Tax=Candidatus Taylorbacteria bacterium RIFCSPHIGHO2_01_FULL_51_15 TaxID=1802304 RepID=A0A1G2MB33_9BACT|nr:MAG: GDP-mannose 4,6-dehydratase [Candidatus Taylorbacteria bacterium RIFCSPHIGHO2_01_FULL_51_15]
MKKRALITGITGQDGSYLADFLVAKGYEVFGMLRRTSTDPLMRIVNLYEERKITLLSGNMRDACALERVIAEAKPDEIYNLAAQSDVGISFLCPEETFEINYYGVGRLVNAAMKENPSVRIYQASTSEMFGKTKPPQSESSPFHPVSPYGEAKQKAHDDYVVGYRNRHHLFICSGILFNHESPRRGKHFVTRKITHSLAKIEAGLQETLLLGNLEAKRDWGFAQDYVEAMWLMLQKDQPEDFVIATGESRTVREFFETAARLIGFKIRFEGKGQDEVAKDEKGKIILKIDPKYYRKAEVDSLLGDASKAYKELGWKPKTSFEELVRIMLEHDRDEVRAMAAKKR